MKKGDNVENQHIFEFFTICKTNIKMRTAASMFGYKSYGTIANHFTKAMNTMYEKFVPCFLGASAFTMQAIENKHTPKMFKEMFPNCKGVIDGGYIKIQKSKHHKIQKKTYSIQKQYNLIKMMDVVLPDGTIFDVFDPFFSDHQHNDESLWNYIVKNNLGGIRDFFDTSYVHVLHLCVFRNIYQ